MITQMKKTLINLPALHYNILRNRAKQRGFASTSEFIREIIRLYIENEIGYKEPIVDAPQEANAG